MSTTTQHSTRSPLSSFSGQRVLVTGAAGFIGSALSRALVQCGAEVHGTSRSLREPMDGIHWWEVDLADPEATARTVRSVEPDLVVHLASYVSGDRSLAAVQPTFRNNLSTTVNLMVAAREVGRPRVILFGSMDEHDPRDPSTSPGSPYAAAKSAASTYGRLFHALYDLPVVRLRVFMVYGPGQRDTTKLVPYVTTSLIRGEQPQLSNGTRRVDWVYVEDVVDAVLAAATGGVADEHIDVGSGRLATVRTVVEQITRLVGSETQPRFGVRQDRPLEHERVANVSRTYELIGWKPATSLDEGLKQTVHWYWERHRPSVGC